MLNSARDICVDDRRCEAFSARRLIPRHFPSGTDAWHLLFSLTVVMLQPAAGISLVSLAPQSNDFQYYKNGIPKGSDLL